MIQRSFYSRQNLLTITIVLVLSYMIAAGGYVGWQQYTRYRDKKAQQSALDSLSPAEKSIRLAESYEANSVVSAQPFQRLLFDYLQRTYDLDVKLSVAIAPLNIANKGERGYSEELYYLARIAYPDIVAKTAPTEALEGASYTNVYAANCDTIPLPKKFWSVMQAQYNKGGYDTTHVALAIRFMRDNGCALSPIATKIEERLPADLSLLIQNKATIPDLRYEAIAFLMLFGRRDLVKQEWINQVVSEQRSDGTWVAQANYNGSTDHPTFLAMWALLQYERPEVKYQPLIRHSN